jgi:hypothetical protein
MQHWMQYAKMGAQIYHKISKSLQAIQSFGPKILHMNCSKNIYIKFFYA